MNKTHSTPTVFDYNDFRKYLADAQTVREKLDPGFNKSTVSRMLGLPNTRSFFNDVLRGKRITTAFVERFIKVFQLKADEARFFRVLVKFNQTSSVDEREMYFEQLISLNQTPRRILERKVFTYYRNWYNSAIRALLNIVDCDGDPAVLARRVFPPISKKQAADALKLLSDLGLIARNRQGFYKPTDASISTPDFVTDMVLKQYQIGLLQNAQNAIVRNRDLPQLVTTNMLSISDNGYQRLEKLIQKFRSQVRSAVHKDEAPATRVFQMNVLLIPSSR